MCLDVSADNVGVVHFQSSPTLKVRKSRQVNVAYCSPSTVPWVLFDQVLDNERKNQIAGTNDF